MDKVSIVGYYGTGIDVPTGQMIKIRTLHDALRQNTNNTKFYIVDTQDAKKKPLCFLISLIKCLLTSNKIVFFAARNGRQYMFAFFYYIHKIFRKDVYHDCLAGSLDIELGVHRNWLKYVNSFKANWMENPVQVEKLKELGVQNATYIPNFKQLTLITEEATANLNYEKPYQFCTFCRVERRKGIEDAVKAIHNINTLHPNTAILDVYGLIETGEEKWFADLQRKYKDDFKYCGVVEYNESTQAIAKYLAMLFPTQYFTEGMPGTIVDAMFAGVPVIARRWKWCDNMLRNGYNSMIYDFNTPELLNDILLKVCNNPQQIIEMKGNCLKEAYKYSVEYNISKIIKKMEIK